MTPGLYVYGIVETGSLTGPVATEGIAGNAAVLIDVEGLTAITSAVDVSEFEGEALQRNAAMPQWLEDNVRAHEAVLEDVLTRATVIPMRFGAIFSSHEGLRRMLTTHAASLRDALERVRGRTEWGVKVHCDAALLVDSLAGPATATSGRGYLEERKARMDAEARAAEDAAAVADAVHRSLAEVADEALVSQARGNEVLNGAYLVRSDGREAFMGRVEELQRGHGRAFLFEVTGPWPPYNFTSADVGGPRP